MNWTSRRIESSFTISSPNQTSFIEFLGFWSSCLVWFSFKQCLIFFSDRTRKSHRKIIFKKCAEITYPISIPQCALQTDSTLTLTKYLKSTINFVIFSGCKFCDLLSVTHDHWSLGTEPKRNSGLLARLRGFRGLELGGRKEGRRARRKEGGRREEMEHMGKSCLG